MITTLERRSLEIMLCSFATARNYELDVINYTIHHVCEFDDTFKMKFIFRYLDYRVEMIVVSQEVNNLYAVYKSITDEVDRRFKVLSASGTAGFVTFTDDSHLSFRQLELIKMLQDYANGEQFRFDHAILPDNSLRCTFQRGPWHFDYIVERDILLDVMHTYSKIVDKLVSFFEEKHRGITTSGYPSKNYALDKTFAKYVSNDISEAAKLAKLDLNRLYGRQCFDIDINMNSRVKKIMEKKKEMKEQKVLFTFKNGKPNPEIKDIIYNPPAVIVFWTDDDKTIVKCGKNDIYDPEKGLAMAITKKFLGNKGNYYNLFTKWLPKDYKKEDKQPRRRRDEKNEGVYTVKDIQRAYDNLDIINEDNTLTIDKLRAAASAAYNITRGFLAEYPAKDDIYRNITLADSSLSMSLKSKTRKGDIILYLEEALGFLGAALE